jgi:hypothetical protein
MIYLARSRHASANTAQILPQPDAIIAQAQPKRFFANRITLHGEDGAFQ